MYNEVLIAGAAVMTEEQWYYLCAQIGSLRALTLAIAQSVPDQEKLKLCLSDQQEIAAAALLGTPAPDFYIDRLRDEIDRLESAIWGQKPPSQP